MHNTGFEQTLSNYDINQDAETSLDHKLKPISEQINFESMSVSLTHLGFDIDLCKELSEHQLHQKLLNDSYFSQNYFHFDISIPLLEAGKRLLFAVMDSEDNFNKQKVVTGGYVMGTTSIGVYKSHIYGLKNGRYAMIALIDENKNSQLDFDSQGNPIEKYATFSDFKPKSMEDVTFKNTSTYFDIDNAKRLVEWK